jgi:DNA polymerase II large subunit
MTLSNYFKEIEDKTRVSYSIAEEARNKGLDPISKVEVVIARSLAEKVVGLISTVYPQINNPQIINRILQLEKEYGQLNPAVYFKIAEEVAKEKFCKFKSLLEAIDAGIRLGFAYTTLGVVSSPMEGYTSLKVEKTKDGKEYFKAYFSGPIRSAGTTASCMVLILIDYLREKMGYAKYDPTEKEVKRYITELYDYHEKVNNLQYLPTEEEIEFLARNIPIQIAGEPTEQKEVSNYKDLERLETNFIRGGMCLIFGEGLAQKARKGLRALKELKSKGFQISDWDFLEQYLEIHKKRDTGTTDTSPTYIKDIVAGRPIFGHPSRSGGFRLRYGRSRTSGFSATSIHPATMGVSDSFLSTGTQLKIERPTKGCVIGGCEGIDGPIVKLKSGAVRILEDLETAKNIYPDIEEIIYLGDILISFGDFLNRNYEILKVGYVEEWWASQLNKKAEEENEEIEIENIFDIDFDSAVNLSRKYKIPLHPKFIYFWTEITYEHFLSLLDWMTHSKIFDSKLILPYNKIEKERFKEGKRALELLGIPHEVALENIILTQKETKSFLFNLGLDKIDTFEQDLENSILKIKNLESKKVLEIVNTLCPCIIKDKAGTFIGTRMGRPEKAKIRKLTGSPNVLFPVGEEGGRLRSVNAANEVGYVKGDFPIYNCEKCNRETIYRKCEKCREECRKLYICPECKQKFTYERCPVHTNLIPSTYVEKKLIIKDYFDQAIKNLDLLPEEIPELVKGVKGTSNAGHIPEPLEKGILRALFNLQVNKDGTIRVDATEMVITHFKPKEIFVSIEKLKSLGYEKDIHGNNLTNDEQILELKPHDIILPCCPESDDESSDEIFMRVANFIDTLLLKFYNIRPFYNIRKREDLVGHLVSCMAPHNCAAVVGRILGFSKTQTFLASPFMHAAMRRDCDGDEAAIMLLLDMLLNFSREFLPAHRGGTQDAPLVLNARIRAGEVDDQILDFEVVSEYPLDLYEKADFGGFHSSSVKVESIKNRLANKEDPFTNIGFTHNTSDINNSVLNSSYKLIPTMQEKVQRQMEVAEKIRAVDKDDVARLVIDRHFIRDIKGNLRKFSQQEFRCSKCNTKYRRPPLTGKCLNCHGNIIFTISEGFIMKYLEPALQLAEKYAVPAYIKQNLDLTKSYIESIFGREKEKQEAISKWF